VVAVPPARRLGLVLGDQLSFDLALFKALGGGWQVPVSTSTAAANPADQQPQAGGKL